MMDGKWGVELMSSGSRPDRLLRQFEDLFATGVVGGLSDGELLERFLQDRSAAGEAAFRAIVERHGPMVLRVCNQTLEDRHAAEDAFQATFLVLARQARAIRKRDSVACWLFGVARRAAARIHVAEARRRHHERKVTPRLTVITAAHSEPSESWPELHAEVERLPEKYRVPIVLCYFEGMTHEQAASLLRWPLGTVKIRLSRAREQLRSRLERRGWPHVSMALAGRWLPDSGTAISGRLVSATAELATHFTAGTAAGGFASPAVLTITRGVLRAMGINKLRLAGIVLFGVLGLGLGAAVVAQQAAGKKQAGAVEPAGAPRVPPTAANGTRFPGSTEFEPEKVIRIHPRLDGRVDKVLVNLGDRVKAGDPLVELFSNKLARVKNDYEVAVSQYARDKKLLDSRFPMAASMVRPPQDLIVAQHNLAKSQVQAEVATLNLMEIGLTQKEIDDALHESGTQKARMILRSPIDGLVIARSASPGEMVQATNLLLVIAQDEPLLVIANVSERDASRFEIGQTLIVRFPFEGRPVNATIKAIGAVVDPSTHTVPVRVSIPNPEHRLRAGMYASVQLETPPRPSEPNKPQRPVETRSNLNVMERLDAVERKIDKLLKEKEDRPTNARVLERLDQIERKLNQLLEDRKDQ